MPIDHSWRGDNRKGQVTTTYSMPSTRHVHSHVTLCVRDLRGKHGCTRTQAHRHTHTRKLWQRKEQNTYTTRLPMKRHTDMYAPTRMPDEVGSRSCIRNARRTRTSHSTAAVVPNPSSKFSSRSAAMVMYCTDGLHCGTGLSATRSNAESAMLSRTSSGSPMLRK